MSIAQIGEIINSSQEVKLESPQPLRRENNSTNKFPIDCLPELLRKAALALHHKIQAPIEICTQSVLAATNLAVQGHANIMLPIGQQRPISCLFLTIAESGERKSSCDNEILSVVEEYESELNNQYKQDLFKWKNKQDAWEKQRSKIQNNAKKYPDYASMSKALDELGEEPEAPLTPLLICPEPTFEGLCKLMIKGLPSLGIFSSEGGQFIAGYGMKEDNKIRTAAALSEMWDGKAIKRVRGGDGTIILNGRRLCMHLMVQPNIATSFLSDSVLQNQGMLSRILVVAPKSMAGSRINHQLTQESIQHLEQFKLRLGDILRFPFKTKANSLNELNPRVISLNEDTKELYYEFADHIEKSIAPNAPHESIKGFANKLAEHVLRIATTFALFENHEVERLEYKYLKMAIKLGEYYAQEALRLFFEGVINPDILLAEKFIDWLKNNWQEENISLPDIYQRSLNSVNTKSKALKIVKILEDHGWLKKNQDKLMINNHLRKDTWKIIGCKNND